MFAHLLQIALLIAGSGSTASGSEFPAVQITLPGFHLGAEEITPGAGWFGVYRDGNGFTLSPRNVSIKPVRNPLADDESDTSSVEIEVSGSERPVFLVRGAPGVEAGQLTSCRFASPPGLLYPGQSQEISLGRGQHVERWHLAATGRAEMATEGPYTRILDFKLHLGHGYGKKYETQILVEFPSVASDVGPSLLWAGDLDRDGKVDVLCDLREHDLTTHLALYLSSAAKEGELVGLVAEWRASSNC